MNRKIIAYENYYNDFFDILDKGTQEKILYGLLLLKTQDRLPAKYVRFLKDGLYELRIGWQGNIYRIFSVMMKGILLYCLVAFKRKRRKHRIEKLIKH